MASVIIEAHDETHKVGLMESIDKLDEAARGFRIRESKT